jgi:methylated-DNA-[protein]-cysteine S-methyltransferase
MVKERFHLSFNSPVGPIEIAGTPNAITSVWFVKELQPSSDEIPPVLLQCKTELEEYFTGKRKQFTVKLDLRGSDFELLVWSELLRLAYGETCSYGHIARQVKNPDAAQAVGLANGRNPVAIIVPCHRVIGQGGKLTGYGGGLWRKQWLLEHEGNVSGKNPTLF